MKILSHEATKVFGFPVGTEDLRHHSHALSHASFLVASFLGPA